MWNILLKYSMYDKYKLLKYELQLIVVAFGR